MTHEGGCVVGCPRLCVNMWGLDVKVTSSSAVSYLNSKTRVPLKPRLPGSCKLTRGQATLLPVSVPVP